MVRTIAIPATLRKTAILRRLRFMISAHGPSALGQSKKPHDKLETLEHASGWGTLVILLGIVIEIWAFFGLDEHDPRERAITLVANCLIAAGLVIEYAAIRLTIVASREANIEADQKVADANQRAAEANQRAAEAMLALEKFRSTRTRVFKEANGEERLRRGLTPWSTENRLTRFTAACNRGDGEQSEFMQELVSSLQKIGWDFLHWGTNDILHPFGHVAVRGVEIEVSQHNRTFADALAAILNEIGITATVTVHGVHDSIRVMVGSKL